MSRHLKVVLCVPPEAEISPSAVDHVLEVTKSHQRDAALRKVADVEAFHVKDPISALAITSKATAMAAKIYIERLDSSSPPSSSVLSTSPFDNSSSTVEVINHGTVICGRLSPRYLLIPTVPSRALVEMMTDMTNGGQGRTVTLAIFAFPGEQLISPQSLAPQLAKTCNLIPQHDTNPSLVSPRGGRSRGLDDYLPMTAMSAFGRPRQLVGPFVEIRSTVEYDALMDALFNSPSFQKVVPMCSVEVVVEFQRTGPEDHHQQRVLHSVWFLHPKHAFEFAETRLGGNASDWSMLKRCTSHYELAEHMTHVSSIGLRKTSVAQFRPVRLSAMMLTALRMDELQQQAAFIQYATTRRYLVPPAAATNAQTNGSEDPAARGADTVHPTVIPADQPRMTGGSGRSDGSTSDPLFIHEGSSNATIHLRRELQRVGGLYDNAEEAFQVAAKRRQAEQDSLKQSHERLQQSRLELAQASQAIAAAEGIQKDLALRLQTLQRQREECEASIRSANEDATKYAQQRAGSAADTERQRAAMIKQHEADVSDAIRLHELRHQKVKEDHLRRMEAAKNEHSRTIEKLSAEYRSKQDEWKRREDGLTKAMSAHVAVQTQLDLLNETLSSKTVEYEQRRRSFDARSRMNDALLEYDTLSPPERLAASSRLAAQLTTERDRLVKEMESLSHREASMAEVNRKLDEEAASLSAALREQQAENDSSYPTMVTAIEAYWKDMRFSLQAMCEFVGMSMWMEEDAYREQLMTTEASMWIETLRVSERRIMDDVQAKHLQEIFELHSRNKTLTVSRDLALRRLHEAEAKVEESKAKHQLVLHETQIHLDRVREEEHNIMMFLEGTPMPATGAAFPTLEDDEAQLRAAMDRVRSTLASGVVIRSSDLPQRKVKAAALMAKAHHVSPKVLFERLERLLHSAEVQKERAATALSNAIEALRNTETELNERKEILDLAVRQTAALENELSRVGIACSACTDELAARREKHNLVRQELQDEYLAARDTTARHEKDAYQHLRKLKQEEEAKMEELQRAKKALQELENRRDALATQNPANVLATLHLNIQREQQRQEELENDIHVEEELVARAKAHHGVSLAPQTSGIGSFRETTTAGLQSGATPKSSETALAAAKTPRSSVVSPAPD